jgi:hypothetical protein
MLEQLHAFVTAGGKVIFVGRTPSMVIDRTFLNPEGAPDLSFATIEPVPDITPLVIAALPKPDVKFNSFCASVKYIHRSLKDGEIYFFFNESDKVQSNTAELSGKGDVQVWNAATGTMSTLKGSKAGKGTESFPLELDPFESRFIIIGPKL